MGLDMYLTAEKYVGGWQHNPEDQRNEYERLVELFGMKEFMAEGSPSANVQFNVGYWRKANQIHSWFVRECQDGIDECQSTPVDIAQLKDLREVCLRVLSSTKLVEGTVSTGVVWNQKHPKGAVQMQVGKILEDPRVAHQLLEPEEGFFFGSQDYDEWYWQDLEDTVAIVDKCVRLYESPGYWSFIYRSSW